MVIYGQISHIKRMITKPAPNRVGRSCPTTAPAHHSRPGRDTGLVHGGSRNNSGLAHLMVVILERLVSTLFQPLYRHCHPHHGAARQPPAAFA